MAASFFFLFAFASSFTTASSKERPSHIKLGILLYLIAAFLFPFLSFFRLLKAIRLQPIGAFGLDVLQILFGFASRLLLLLVALGLVEPILFESIGTVFCCCCCCLLHIELIDRKMRPMNLKKEERFGSRQSVVPKETLLGGAFALSFVPSLFQPNNSSSSSSSINSNKDTTTTTTTKEPTSQPPQKNSNTHPLAL